MNPSASGWIKKHISIFEKEIVAQNFSEEEFYKQLKETGFIYANSVSTISYPNGTTYQLTLEELSKINLFDSLGYRYFKRNPQAEAKDFIKAAIEFYDYLKKNSWFNFHLPFIKISSEEKFEKIITNRIQTNQSFFHKNFSALITNALLYLDVLTFDHFLEIDGNPIDFAKSLEAPLGK